MSRLTRACALLIVGGVMVGCASPAPTRAPSVAPTDSPSVVPTLSPTPAPSPSPVVSLAPSPVASLGAATLSLEARDLSFTPRVLEAVAEQAFELTLHNAGRIPHNVTIDAPGVRLAVAAGQTSSVDVEGLPAGDYPFYCSVSGHREAGMSGTLTVR